MVGENFNGTISNSFYDKTKYTGNGVGGDGSDQTGVTGKTTQEMSYGGTFKNASWDIVADSSVTSLTPVIKWDSINNKYVWAIAPLALTYTLTDKTTTYNGTTQNLSTFYNNSTNIFGTNHSFIDLSKYKFQVAGNDVTGYKDAAIYDNIKLVNNSDSFAILNASGNTDGKLTINKKDLTISNITANNKTYDGTTTATLGNIGTLVGLVAGEDLVLNNPTSVIFSSKDVGDNIDVTASGYTIADKDSFKASNYNLLDTSKTTTANIVASVNPTPTPTPTDNNQKPKVDEQVQKVVASIEPSTNSNSNSSSNQSLPNSLNSNIRTLSFNGVDEIRVINGGVKMPENIANEEDIIK